MAGVVNVEELKSMYGFLGLGACGGNQVSCFEQYGMSTFYINSAIEDIKSLGKDVHYYHIPDSVGCHRDRLVSKQYLATNCDGVLEQVERYLGDTEYVFLFASADGGTSSGQAALLTSLIEEEFDKKVIPFITIPEFKTASLRAKKNTYDCLVEVFEAAQHSVFIIDNNKEPDYDKNNTMVSKNLYALISDISNSKQGIFDRSEINSMLDKKGYSFVNRYARKSTHTDATPEIIKAIKGGVHLDLEKTNTLYYLGLKVNTTKKTTTVDYDGLQLDYGRFDTSFVGYQTNDNVICMTGLNEPVEFMSKLDQDIQKEETQIAAELQKKNQRQVLQHRKSILSDVKEQTAVSSRQEKKPSAREQLMQMMKK